MSDLLTPELRAALRANALAHHDAVTNRGVERGSHQSSTLMDALDPAPVVRLFNPCGAATWLATELDADGDTLFGLADLGFGCPELGSFSLSGVASVRLPFGLSIERDFAFRGHFPLSAYAEAARSAGSILAAERLMRTALLAIETQKLPDLSEDGAG
jgi:hypothetical protein